VKIFLALAGAFLCKDAFCQVAPLNYPIDSVRAMEDAKSIIIHMPTTISIQVLPGGHTWPFFGLDEEGRIYVGATIIDAKQGKVLSPNTNKNKEILALPHGYNIIADKGGYRFSHRGKMCTVTQQQLGLNGKKSNLQALKDRNLIFASSDQQLLALATRFGPDKSADIYLINTIDLDKCKVTHQNLGNPDLLVELNRSAQGGWWITGSIEQTLLRSKDGKNWHSVILPTGLSSLVSSYLVNDREIWLAAMLPDSEEEDPLLVYSGDGGKTWRNIRRDDPVLQRLPKGWLEGRKRLAQATRQ
jgi:hypothetical protein